MIVQIPHLDGTVTTLPTWGLLFMCALVAFWLGYALSACVDRSHRDPTPTPPTPPPNERPRP